VPKPLEPAFYCWETVFEPDTAALALLDSFSCKTLYVKILDIGKNASSGNIEPYARLELRDTAAWRSHQMIPCIFITNEVFTGISREKMQWLAGKISTAARDFAPFKEFQVDCDWTGSTREAYFYFLTLLRKQLPEGTALSATIRLHQYKFPKKTGVPPVDRGMLMFYNTGDVDEDSDRNSIFHPEDARKYLDGAPSNYPLPLDLALPLFSWAQVFREGELWKIIPGPLPLAEMRTAGKYRKHGRLEPFPSVLWEVQEGTFLGGHYLRPGDRLRVSEIPQSLLMESAQLARRLDLADDARLAFFHLGIAPEEHFSAQQLDLVCKTVRN
ncbi:MAG: hypothetical protein IT261_00850, partial [Saprospiraceae bacterium]|nr:hypothetical protein [Saprospiraceae bacterium]